MSFGAVAYSFRPNEIRLDEVAHQVPDTDQFEVVTLDEWGNEQRVIVGFGQKWGARGWRRELQCNACTSTARVLHVVQGHAVCRKCFPLTTSHHLHKNSKAWQRHGAMVDKFLRSLLKPGESAAIKGLARLLVKLKRNIFDDAKCVLRSVHWSLRVTELRRTKK